MGEEVQLIDIELIDPPIDASRDTIDPNKIRELAESVREHGLYEPVLLRPMNGRFEIVYGHRRFLAHRLLGEVKVKSFVREMTDEECLIARAIENDQREDLNPIEKAKNYKRLREKHGMTLQQIAQKMGRHFTTIHKYLQLLEVPEEFQGFISNGTLSMQVALILCEIEDVSFKRYYIDLAVKNGITADVARLWVDDNRKTQEGRFYSEGGGGGGEVSAGAPVPIFNTCVCCLGPVEVNKVRYIPVCPDCEPQIKGALKDNGKK